MPHMLRPCSWSWPAAALSTAALLGPRNELAVVCQRYRPGEDEPRNRALHVASQCTVNSGPAHSFKANPVRASVPCSSSLWPSAQCSNMDKCIWGVLQSPRHGAQPFLIAGRHWAYSSAVDPSQPSTSLAAPCASGDAAGTREAGGAENEGSVPGKPRGQRGQNMKHAIRGGQGRGQRGQERRRREKKNAQGNGKGFSTGERAMASLLQPKIKVPETPGQWTCVQGCGACCLLDKGPQAPPIEDILTDPQELKLFHSMVGEDGWCRHFDKSERNCMIYQDRPRFCRVEPEVFWDLYSIPEHAMSRVARRYCVDTISDIFGGRSPEMVNFKKHNP